MALLPAVYGVDFEERRFLLNHRPLVRGQAVILDKVTRSPNQPTHWIEPGTVVVRRNGGHRFLPADHPDGERNQPASVSALQAADAAWGGSVLTVSLAEGLGFPVTLPQGAKDNAAAIDALNQSAGFAAHFLADEDAQGRVRIQSRRAGADAFFHVRSSLNAAFGPQGSAAHGLDADYRVTDAWADVLELPGKPIHALVPSLLVAHFLEDQLLALTPEARVVLSRRGSIFA